VSDDVFHLIDLRSERPALDWIASAARATAQRLEGAHRFCVIGPSLLDPLVRSLGIAPDAFIRTGPRRWPTLGRALRSLMRGRAASARGVVCWSAGAAWLTRRSTPWRVPVAFVPLDDPDQSAGAHTAPAVGILRANRDRRRRELGIDPGQHVLMNLAADGTPHSTFAFMFLCGYAQVAGYETTALLRERPRDASAPALRLLRRARNPSAAIVTRVAEPHLAEAADAAVWIPPHGTVAPRDHTCPPLVLCAIESASRCGLPVVAPTCDPIERLVDERSLTNVHLALNATAPELVRTLEHALTTRPEASNPTTDLVPDTLLERINLAFQSSNPSRPAHATAHPTEANA